MRCPRCNGAGHIGPDTRTTRAAAEALLALGEPVTVAALATAAEVSKGRARLVIRKLAAEGVAEPVDMPATVGRPPTGWVLASDLEEDDRRIHVARHGLDE